MLFEMKASSAPRQPFIYVGQCSGTVVDELTLHSIVNKEGAGPVMHQDDVASLSPIVAYRSMNAMSEPMCRITCWLPNTV